MREAGGPGLRPPLSTSDRLCWALTSVGSPVLPGMLLGGTDTTAAALVQSLISAGLGWESHSPFLGTVRCQLLDPSVGRAWVSVWLAVLRALGC